MDSHNGIYISVDDKLMATCRAKEHKRLKRQVSRYSQQFQTRQAMEREDVVPYEKMAYGCLIAYGLFIILIEVCLYYFNEQKPTAR